jgi:hypothetical protein
LIERIGDEIDKRVDARLGARPRSPRSSRSLTEAEQSARRQALWTGGVIGTGAGAGITGIAAMVAMVANDGMRPELVPTVITVWLILAVIALGLTLARRYRNQGCELRLDPIVLTRP